jgi:hypothetical protein
MDTDVTLRKRRSCPWVNTLCRRDTHWMTLADPKCVTVKEVNHIRCFAIDIAKYLILISCRLAMEHLCVLQLETALATLVTTWFTLVDRRCFWLDARTINRDQFSTSNSSSIIFFLFLEDVGFWFCKDYEIYAIIWKAGYYKCQTIHFSENRTRSQIKHFFDHVQHT